MLDILNYFVMHAVPGIQAARDAGIQYIDTEGLKRYLDIVTEGRLARLERLRGDR
jgi:hypothetical protein